MHSILCILTDEAGEASVVPFEIEGIASSDTTQGHRFMAPDTIRVSSFDDYAAKLKRANVILSAEDRAEAIWHDATQAAFAQGLELVEDKGLLREVAGLVEWPVVLLGEISEDFLSLPPEVLQTSMKEHQKFFSVKDKSGRIVRFATVANRETQDNGKTVLHGNQKVLSARLADAKFFWENDQRVATTDITQWTDALKNVTFHNKLGSQHDRIRRIAALSRDIAPLLGVEPDEAETSALVAKADLSSEMVYEFPELQGVMGEHYAIAAELSDEISVVAREHYQPLGPSDDVPEATLSVTVALADKLDTLAGFWAIDEKPTGSKDPFALRRAALGVIRLVLAGEHRLSLDRFIDAQLVRLEIANGDGKKDKALLDAVLDEIADHGVFGAAIRAVVDRIEGDAPEWIEEITQSVPDTGEDLLGFIHDRLKVHLRDEGLRHDVIDACLAMPGSDDLTLLVMRARALSDFLKTEDGENLLQGFKRAHNILRQAEEKDGVEYSFGPDPKLAETDEEKALFEALDKAEAAIQPAMAEEDFKSAMGSLAGLRTPIDAFFDTVQVNVDSEILRRNRLNLLHRISAACLAVADLRRIEG